MTTNILNLRIILFLIIFSFLDVYFAEGLQIIRLSTNLSIVLLCIYIECSKGAMDGWEHHQILCPSKLSNLSRVLFCLSSFIVTFHRSYSCFVIAVLQATISNIVGPK